MAEHLELAQRALVAQSAKRLRLEREVQQAQKLVAVGMLAAQVAHEVGTPLNVIAGRAEALGRAPRARPPGPPPAGGDPEPDRSHRRDRARPARLHASPAPDAAAGAAAAAAGTRRDLVEGRDRARGVRVRMDVPAGAPAVLGDADQLQQVFINLLANALDASPAGGTVTVTDGPSRCCPPAVAPRSFAGMPSRLVVSIHVVDEGPGMTADELAQVFQPFFSTKNGQGTGLGLPIVEEIVRAHRGEVEMLSVAGHGTEVIVRLPRPAPTETPARSRSPCRRRPRLRPRVACRLSRWRPRRRGRSPPRASPWPPTASS